MAVVFVKNEAGWNDMVRGPTGPVSRMLLRVGRDVTRLSKAQAGRKSGALQASIGYAVKPYRTSLMVEIGSSKKYALLHHEGTRAHPIYPRRAKMLVFYWRGRMNYRYRVYHPGTKPNPYLTGPLDLIMARFPATFG